MQRTVVRLSMIVFLLMCFLSTSLTALEISLFAGATNDYYPEGYEGVEDAEIISSNPNANTGGNWDAMVGSDTKSVRRLLLRWQLDKLAPLLESDMYKLVSARVVLKEWYAGGIPNQQINVYQVADANKGWVHGTGGPYNWDIVQAGSVSWNAVASGSASWAGEAGCGKPGVDYHAEPLATIYANDDPRRPSPRNLISINIPLKLIKYWATNPDNNAGLLFKSEDEFSMQLSYFTASENPKTTADPYPKLMLSFVDMSNMDTDAVSFIVKSSKAACVVILPEDASASERFAAKELIDHIKDMTGVELTQMSENLYTPDLGAFVSIGRTEYSKNSLSEEDFEKLGAEGYRIFVKDNNTYITGGRKRGSLYGVYEYLESLGVRWYSPEWTLTPKKIHVRMPSKTIEYKPAFIYRDQYWNNTPTRIWYARMRLNGEIAGIPDEMGGSARTLLGCHSLENLVPADEFFDLHPEWFALKENGERSKKECCLTNPDLRDFVRDKVLQMVGNTNGWAEDIWVGQSDGSLDGCYCEECTAERIAHGGKERWSANLMPFVNYIADAMHGKYPAVKIKTLAYSYTTDAPEDMTVADNITVEICGNFIGPNDKHAELVKSWSNIAKNIQLYTYGGSNCGYWWPYPNVVDMAMQTKWALQNGVNAFYVQGTAFDRGSGLVDLRAYLTARLSWDSSRDIKKEIEDFCRGFYGPGGKYIAQYIISYTDYVRKHNLSLAYMWGDADAWKNWVTKDIVQDADALFQKALNATKNNPRYHRHVRRAYLEVFWASIMVNLNDKPVFDGENYVFFPSEKIADVQERVKLFTEIMSEANYNVMQEYELFEPGKSQLDIITRDYKAYKLSNSQTELWVVPALGGRIVSWNIPLLGGNIWRVSGGSNPYSSGYEELGSVPVEKSDFRVVSADNNTLIVKATPTDEIEVIRTFSLDKTNPTLNISSKYKNISDKPVKLNIRTRPVLEFELFAGFQFYTNDKNGKWVPHDLWSSSVQNDQVYFDIADSANPVWILGDKKNGIGLVNRYDASAIRTLYTYYGKNYGGINMEIWGNNIVLEPNHSWILEHSYEAVSNLEHVMSK